MTFEEQFEQLQKMFDSSDCDIEVLPPDEEKAKKLRAQGGEFTPLAAIPKIDTKNTIMYTCR